jgi:hypothetical protein
MEYIYAGYNSKCIKFLLFCGLFSNFVIILVVVIVFLTVKESGRKIAYMHFSGLTVSLLRFINELHSQSRASDGWAEETRHRRGHRNLAYFVRHGESAACHDEEIDRCARS